jgi:hypothetical protein
MPVSQVLVTLIDRGAQRHLQRPTQMMVLAWKQEPSQPPTAAGAGFMDP